MSSCKILLACSAFGKTGPRRQCGISAEELVKRTCKQPSLKHGITQRYNQMQSIVDKKIVYFVCVCVCAFEDPSLLKLGFEEEPLNFHPDD